MSSSRARLFKKKYRPYWRLSAQKESFVKVLLESWGFRVRPVGLGSLSARYVEASGSKPDFAVYDFRDELVCFIEVTGANMKVSEKTADIYVTYDKYLKYQGLVRKIPVYFIYLGFSRGKLSVAKYIDYQTLKYFAKNIKKRSIRGVEEVFIVTPRSAWRPLRELYYELVGVIG